MSDDGFKEGDKVWVEDADGNRHPGVFVGMNAMGFWSDDRGTNMLDGGAHFYGVYETSDGGYISIASYEPQFYAELVKLLVPLGIPLDPATQMDQAAWPGLKQQMGALFRTRTRDAWVEFFRLFPLSSGLIELSPVRFSSGNRVAETFVGRTCGAHCQNAWRIVAKRDRSGAWKVAELQWIRVPRT